MSLGEKRQVNMTQFGIILNLPPVGASDVAKRELSVTVGTAEPVIKVMDGQPLKSDELIFNADDEVVVTLTDIDGHNNRSPHSAPLSFKVVDDVAPPAPGDLSVFAKRQIDTPDAPPAPPAPPQP